MMTTRLTRCRVIRTTRKKDSTAYTISMVMVTRLMSKKSMTLTERKTNRTRTTIPFRMTVR